MTTTAALDPLEDIRRRFAAAPDRVEPLDDIRARFAAAPPSPWPTGGMSELDLMEAGHRAGPGTAPSPEPTGPRTGAVQAVKDVLNYPTQYMGEFLGSLPMQGLRPFAETGSPIAQKLMEVFEGEYERGREHLASRPPPTTAARVIQGAAGVTGAVIPYIAGGEAIAGVRAAGAALPIIGPLAGRAGAAAVGTALQLPELMAQAQKQGWTWKEFVGRVGESAILNSFFSLGGMGKTGPAGEANIPFLAREAKDLLKTTGALAGADIVSQAAGLAPSTVPPEKSTVLSRTAAALREQVQQAPETLASLALFNLAVKLPGRLGSAVRKLSTDVPNARRIAEKPALPTRTDMERAGLGDERLIGPEREQLQAVLRQALRPEPTPAAEEAPPAIKAAEINRADEAALLELGYKGEYIDTLKPEEAALLARRAVLPAPEQAAVKEEPTRAREIRRDQEVPTEAAPDVAAVEGERGRREDVQRQPEAGRGPGYGPPQEPVEAPAPTIKGKRTPRKEPWQMTPTEFAKNFTFKKKHDDRGDSGAVTGRGSLGHHLITKATDAKTAYKEAREWMVRYALYEGKPVPPEVLADYPDLVKPTIKGKRLPRPPEKAGPAAAPPRGTENATFSWEYQGPQPPVEPETSGRRTPAVKREVLELPELVDLAQQLLSGKTPFTVKKLPYGPGRSALGVSILKGQEAKIGLLRDIFIGPRVATELHAPKDADAAIEEMRGHILDAHPELTEDGLHFTKRMDLKAGKIRVTAYVIDPDFAGRVLAHEIGHVVDWTPEKTLKRGNILGHVAALRRYMTQSVEAEGGRVFEQKSVREELKALTQWWTPFDPEANPEYTKFRNQSKELYAEALSVLLNNPTALRERAPLFGAAFDAFLERRPEAQVAYEGIQTRIREGMRLEVRDKRLADSLHEGNLALLRKLHAGPLNRDGVLMALRLLFVDNASAVNDLAARRRRLGLADVGSDPQLALESAIYSGSQNKARVNDVKRNVLRALEAGGLTWEDLDAVLFHERVIHERSLLANPQGYQPNSSQEALGRLRDRLGPERWKSLQNITEGYHAIRSEHVIPAMQAARMWSPELMDYIVSNEHYATFMVRKFLEDRYGRGITARIYPQFGTLEDIAGPALATVVKDAMLIRAAAYNTAKRSVIEALQATDPERIGPADTIRRGKQPEFMDPKDPSQRLLVYLDEGKPKGFYVPENIATAFDRGDGVAMQIAAGLCRAVGTPFRLVFTGVNPGFWLFNICRDYQRTVRNLPGLGPTGYITFARRWINALPKAWQAEFGNPGGTVREMLRQNMLISWGDIAGLTHEEKVFERMIADLGHKPGGLMRQAIRPLQTAFHALLKLGSVLEETPKIAGYEYLKQRAEQPGAYMAPEEIAHLVRTQIGSPPFLIHAKLTPITNNLLLFSNPFVQGWRTDIEAVRRDPKGVTTKMAVAALLPKVIQYGLASGAVIIALKQLGYDDDEPVVKWADEMRRLLGSASEYDLTNYMVLPLGWSSNGRAIYLRLPMEEQTRFLGGFFWKLLNAPEKGLRGVQQALDFTAGQFPSVNPAISAGMATLQYLSGQNPYDWFRQRTVLPENLEKARTWGTTAAFAKWMAEELGSGIVYRFGYETIGEVKTELEEVLGMPVVSNTLGRFLKVSDRGAREGYREAAGEAEQGRAREIEDLRAIARKQAAGKPLTTEESALAQRNQPYLRDQAKKIGVKGGSSLERALSEAPTTAGRYAILEHAVKDNDPALAALSDEFVIPIIRDAYMAPKARGQAGEAGFEARKAEYAARQANAERILKSLNLSESRINELFQEARRRQAAP